MELCFTIWFFNRFLKINNKVFLELIFHFPNQTQFVSNLHRYLACITWLHELIQRLTNTHACAWSVPGMEDPTLTQQWLTPKQLSGEWGWEGQCVHLSPTEVSGQLPSQTRELQRNSSHFKWNLQLPHHIPPSFHPLSTLREGKQKFRRHGCHA